MFIANPEHRAFAAKIWRIPEGKLPKRVGYHAMEMFRALDRGGQSGDPEQLLPHLQEAGLQEVRRPD